MERTFSITIDNDARQSGKTTRLIQRVIQHISSPSAYIGTDSYSSNSYNRTATIIAANRHLSSYIQEKLKVLDGLFPNQITYLVNPTREELRIKSSGSSKRFYDEYQLCQYVEWRGGDYYCGTDE